MFLFGFLQDQHEIAENYFLKFILKMLKNATGLKMQLLKNATGSFGSGHFKF